MLLLAIFIFFYHMNHSFYEHEKSLDPDWKKKPRADVQLLVFSTNDTDVRILMAKNKVFYQG